MTFQELGLNAPIIKALEDMGYQTPTPIQEKAIPAALAGRDVLGCAQTGTGKTCAFAAPILQRLSAGQRPGRPIRALILTPTRELALQIQENFELYGKNLPLRSAVIFGGVGQNPQVDALRRGTDVLVATPGRLMDLYQQKFVDLSRLEIFVLDEADRMLDMGFIHDVRKILRWLPEKKQTMLFSATMPPEIADLVNSLLRDPVRVAVDPVSSPVEVIRQSVYFVDKGNKTKLLAHLLEELRVKNALVFTRTKHGANKVAKDLAKLGVTAAAIHGNKSQTARQQALADFKEGRVQCLVATDIAARGLDIEELSHVFNYNLPEVPETYVHRIGRTGRAGHGGTAVALCDYAEIPLLRAIEKLMGRSVPVVEDHPWPMVVLEAPKRDKNGRIVNEEDAEARAAARERRRQRDAANKAAAQARQEAAAARAAAEQAKREAAQAKKAAAQAQKARQAEEAAAKKKGRRGVRNSATLEEALTAVEPRRPERAQPVYDDFQKPDPLAGDVIMDSTARLLSSRRPLPVREDRPRSQRRKKEERKGQRQEQTAQKQEKAAPKAQPAPKAEARRHKDRGRSRRPMEPDLRRHGQKDSTEQPSLMKPYYLNDD